MGNTSSSSAGSSTKQRDSSDGTAGDTQLQPSAITQHTSSKSMVAPVKQRELLKSTVDNTRLNPSRVPKPGRTSLNSMVAPMKQRNPMDSTVGNTRLKPSAELKRTSSTSMATPTKQRDIWDRTVDNTPLKPSATPKDTSSKSVFIPVEQRQLLDSMVLDTRITYFPVPRQHKICRENMCRCYEFRIWDRVDTCIDIFISENISTSTYTSATEFLELSFADYNEKPLWQYGFPALSGHSSGITTHSDEPSKDVTAGGSEVPVSKPQDKQIIVISDDEETSDESDSDVEELINAPLIISGNGEPLVGSTDDYDDDDETITDIDEDSVEETFTHRGSQEENDDNDNLPYHRGANSVPAQRHVESLEELSEGFISQAAFDLAWQKSSQPLFDSSTDDDDKDGYQPKSQDSQSDTESEEYHPSPKTSRPSARKALPQASTSCNKDDSNASKPATQKSRVTKRAPRPKADEPKPKCQKREPRASTGKKDQRLWPKDELEVMCLIMTHLIENERPQGLWLGESIYAEAARRLVAAGFIPRTPGSIKNKYSRYGRDETETEERKYPRGPGLKTSVRKKRQAVDDDDEDDAGHQPKKVRKRRANEDDEDEEDDAGHQPKKIRKRRTNDDDEDEAGHQPKKVRKRKDVNDDEDDAGYQLQHHQPKKVRKRRADTDDEDDADYQPKKARKS